MVQFIALLSLFICNIAFAAAPTRQSSYETNTVISSDAVTSNENVIFNYLQAGVDVYADNSIYNADVASDANIQTDKLNLTSVAQSFANTGTFANTGNATITGTLTVSSTVSANGVTNATLPAGAIMMWGTNTAPTGWLLCDGSAVSRTTYSGLFAVISTTFGSGDGSTTFNVPDMRGRFPLGQDDMGGSSANRVTDTDADTIGGADGDETKDISHNHGGFTGGVDYGASSGEDTAGTIDTKHYHSIASGGSATQDFMNPFLTLNFCIKY